MKNFIRENKSNPWFWLFIVIAAALLVAMPLMSLKSGNSGDEDAFQIPQGKNVINWFESGGADSTCLTFSNLKYYGSSFDVVTEFINEKLHIDDISTSRHIMNSLMGWLAVLMVGLIAYAVGGARAGVFAMLLLFLSPRFLGHSFNNPKDIPFATGVIASIYGMILFFKQFPKVKWYTYVILILSIALAISIRIGGLILFGYFGLLGLMYLILYFMKNKRPADHFISRNTQGLTAGALIGKMVGFALIICVAGYFAGLLLWPFALQSPFKHPFEAYTLMSNFDVSLRQVFEGSQQWSDLLPWYYTPKFILITIPVAVILGIILFCIFCWRTKEDRFWAFFILFTFVFPVFWIVYTGANVYGGWRHSLFVYPPMVVAAGWGFDGLVKWVEKKLGVKTENTEAAQENAANGDVARNVSTKGIVVNVASLVVLLVLLIGPIHHIFANHPYEYVYFNKLAGGTAKALGNYEMDYYYHSTREASEWVKANAEKRPDGKPVVVSTWHTASVSYFLRHDTADFRVKFVRWYEKGNSDWDYAIFTVTGMNPDYLKSKAFPPKNTVKTVEVDGVPIAIVLKRDDKTDLEAFKLKEANSLDSAAVLYQKILQDDPNNLDVLSHLGEIYLRMNKLDSAKMYMDRYLAFEPSSDNMNYLYAYLLINQNKLDEALNVLHKIEKNNPKFGTAYSMAIQIYLQKRDMVAAKKEFMKVIDHDLVSDQIVQLWLQYSAMQNIGQQQAIYNLYNTMAKSLDKRGKHKEAEQYRKAIGR